MINVGDKVSLWVEGEVVGISKRNLGILIEVIHRSETDCDAHCFVPMSAIEPRSPEVRRTLAELLEEEHEVLL